MKEYVFSLQIILVMFLAACGSNHKVEFVETTNAATELEENDDTMPENKIVQTEATRPMKMQRKANAAKVEYRSNDVQKAGVTAAFMTESTSSTENEEKPNVINHPILVKETFEELGVSSPKADLDFISAKEIASRFEDFVSTVDKNKKEYTVQDWEKINTMWETLLERNKEIKKIKLRDRLKITSQRTKYSLMKSFRRATAKRSKK
jgi:hypothetical protein